MKYLSILLVCLFVSVVQAAETNKPDVAPAPTPKEEEFKLKVKFETPITWNHEIETEIAVGRPFAEKMRIPEGGYIAVTGLLQSSKDGTYPLLITLIDWKSDDANSLGITQPVLTLDKPHSWGVSMGIVHSYTVTISKIKEGQQTQNK